MSVDTSHIEIWPPATRCASARPASSSAAPRRPDSLACLFFEVLAGSLPFPQEDDAGLLSAHVTQPPPALSQRLPGAPAAVDDALARGLAKNPAERPASCRQLVAELRAGFRDTAAAPDREAGRRASVPPPPPPTLRASRPPAAPAAPPPGGAYGRQGGGAAVPPGGPPVRRPSGRRFRRSLAGAAVAAVLAVAVALWLVLAPPWTSWVRYDGGDATAPFALEHPAAWLQHPDRQGVMFAQQHLVGVFTTGDPGKWDQAARSAGTPERVEGVLVRRTTEQVSLSSADGAETTVRAIPAFTHAVAHGAAHATVHGAQAWRLDGRLVVPRGPGGLQIAYECFLVPFPGGAAHVVFFALPDRLAGVQATFDRIRDSVELPQV